MIELAKAFYLDCSFGVERWRCDSNWSWRIGAQH